jgi:hypothetical protein
MPLSSSVPIIWFIIPILVILGGMFATRQKRSQIFCWFEGEDGTNEHKWVKEVEGWVVFRNKKYKIMTERMSNMWVKGGIHAIFPTRASSLSFVWYSQYPRDPRNFSRTVVSPQIKKILNIQEIMESYFRTQNASAKGKQSILQKYGWIIGLAVIGLLFWYLNNADQQILNIIRDLANRINTLSPK